MTREQFEMKESNWKREKKQLEDTIFALKVNRDELKEKLIYTEQLNRQYLSEINSLKVDIDNLITDNKKTLSALFKLIEKM